MSKYVYENHEVEEGLFVTLQLIDAIDMKYSCCFPADIEKDIEKLSRHLVKYVEGEDKHPNVDIENTKLIQQFIYNKDDIDKIEKITNSII